MSVFDVWMEWLGIFGVAPFFVSMTVFLGGYVLIRPKLIPGTHGQRIALALVCLVGGFLVGGMMGSLVPDIDTAVAETAEMDSSEHPVSGIFIQIIGSSFWAVFVYAVASNLLKNRMNNVHKVSLAIAVTCGVLFFLVGPEMTFPTVVVFGILLWIISRLIRRYARILNPD